MRPDAKATREHWDRLAATYDQAKARNDVYYRSLKDLFNRAIHPSLRRRVLEVGCGTGGVLASLEPDAGLGVDISERMIEKARSRFAGADNLSFKIGDATEVAALGPFDAVISADVFEHVPDWRAVARAMVGACRPGGVVAISTPNPGWAVPLWVLEKTRLKMPEGPHLFVGARAIANLLSDRGCTIQRRTTHLLLPANLAGVGRKVSEWAETAAVLRRWGVIQLVVARKNDENRVPR